MIVIDVFARDCEPRCATDAEQHRLVMTQTSCASVAVFPFRCAGSAPAAISLDPITSTSPPITC